MPVVVSVDLGTTKITSLAMETESGDVLAVIIRRVSSAA
jgi:cell division ATPase FtsA